MSPRFFSPCLWFPWLIVDFEVLERVQKRTVNMILGLKGRTYKEKLIELNLTTLLWNKSNPLTFNILKDLDSVDHIVWFKRVGDKNGRLMGPPPLRDEPGNTECTPLNIHLNTRIYTPEYKAQ